MDFVFINTYLFNTYLCLFTNIFQNICFIFNKRKQVIQGWNQLK